MVYIYYNTSVVKQTLKENTKMNKLTRENAIVGNGATLRIHTDCHAYTIIKVTDSTVTLQRDIATRTTKPEIIAGGFTGLCTNNDKIEYAYESDTNGETVKCHYSNKQERFNCKGYASVTAGRNEYYDYNF
jgi:Zn ribbon nucleic-acid-binding protein